MRTLKKVLALTIALATLFSLTAFAGFTDEDAINDKLVEDVNLMGALNIMVGDREGTFRPNDTISRAEAAKMVYVLRNGGNDDKATGWTNMNTFSDVVKGSWYEGYVNYCASVGIIAGVGNGKFNPDGAVTGTELAKMLLVVAGYKPDVQGYTGPNWALNVAADAQMAGLLDGYTLAYSAAAPRQWAAKLFSNAVLKTHMAVYLAGELVGDLFGSKTVGENFYGLKTATGVLVATNYVKQAAQVNASTKMITISTEKNGLLSFECAASADLLQQEVTVVYDATTDTVYSVYATGKSNVYEVNFADVTFKKVNTNDLSIAFEGYAATVYEAKENGKLDMVFYYNNDLSYATGRKTVEADDVLALVNANMDGALRMVDTDGDSIIDVVFGTVSDYATVSAINAAKNIFTAGTHKTNGNKDAFAKYNFVDSVSKGDVVKITVDVTGKNTVYNVERLEAAASGKITKVNAGNTVFTVGGVEYKVSGLAATGTNTALTLGNEVDLYTDGKFVVYAAKTGEGTISELTSNLAYVIAHNEVKGQDEMGQETKVNKVQVLLPDGTTKIYVYANNTTAQKANYVEFASVADDTVYEYVLSGEKMTFKKTITAPESVKVGNASANATLDVDKKTFDGKLFDADTYFFVKSKNSKNEDVYAVMKATEFTANQSNKAAKQFAYSKVNGIDTVIFGVLNLDTVIASGTSEDFVFVTGDWYNTLNDKNEIIQMVAAVNSKGEKVELLLASTDGVAAGKVYKAETTDGKTTLSESSFALDAITGFNGSDLLQLKTKGLVKVTADTKTFYVDVENGEATLVEGEDFTFATYDDANGNGEMDGGESLYNNALVIVNEKNEVTAIFVEVDGEDLGGVKYTA